MNAGADNAPEKSGFFYDIRIILLEMLCVLCNLSHQNVPQFPMEFFIHGDAVAGSPLVDSFSDLFWSAHNF
jgi:hypothetical protein